MTVLQSSCCWLATLRTIISRCQRVRNGILGSIAGDYIDLKSRLKKRGDVRACNAWEHVHHYGKIFRRLKKRNFWEHAHHYSDFSTRIKKRPIRARRGFWVISRAIIVTFQLESKNGPGRKCWNFRALGDQGGGGWVRVACGACGGVCGRVGLGMGARSGGPVAGLLRGSGGLWCEVAAVALGLSTRWGGLLPTASGVRLLRSGRGCRGLAN
jgi:hypothetical protein